MSSFDDNSKPRRAIAAAASVKSAAVGGGATVISIVDRLPASARPRPLDTSADLVDRVAERIGVMAGRTRELEHYVERFEEWSNAQIDAVEQVADHWRNVTALAEMKVDDLQRSLDFGKRRAELAEGDLQNVRFRLELLHERIEKVFGTAAKTRARRGLAGID